MVESWGGGNDKMDKRILANTTIHRICTVIHSEYVIGILHGKLSYRSRHGNLWDIMGIADTLEKG